MQIRFALYEQTEYSRNESMDSHHAFQSNPYILTWLGKQKHLFDADLTQANDLYKQALIVNPVYIPAWLGLAELQVDQNENENANAILDYTGVLSEDVKRWRWDKVLVAYQFGRNDVLASDLSYIIAEIPGKTRNNALRMAFSLWPDAKELQKQLGEESLEYLFQYATRKRKVEQGLILWENFRTKTFDRQEKDTLAFINMLIGKSEIASAATIWKNYFNNPPFLFNGDFNKKPLQTAFGWRIGKNKGATWQITEPTKKEPRYAFKLHFKRQKNINLHNIMQIVPLQGGRVYALKGEVKTKNLTTDQLPFFEVYGYKCKAPRNTTKMFSSDQDWTEIFLLIQVPDDCDAMVVRLRRKESTHIDNILGGDIWLANLEIAESSEIYTILDEK